MKDVIKNYLLAANMILKTDTLDFEGRSMEIEAKTHVPAEFILECLEDLKFEIMLRWHQCAKDAQAIIQKVKGGA